MYLAPLRLTDACVGAAQEAKRKGETAGRAESSAQVAEVRAREEAAEQRIREVDSALQQEQVRRHALEVELQGHKHRLRQLESERAALLPLKGLLPKGEAGEQSTQQQQHEEGEAVSHLLGRSLQALKRELQSVTELREQAVRQLHTVELARAEERVLLPRQPPPTLPPSITLVVLPLQQRLLHTRNRMRAELRLLHDRRRRSTCKVWQP